MKKYLFIIGLCLAFTPSNVKAQGCAMCTKTASQLDPKSARGLNNGILFIAFLPLTILSTIGYFWWKQSKPKAA